MNTGGDGARVPQDPHQDEQRNNNAEYYHNFAESMASRKRSLARSQEPHHWVVRQDQIRADDYVDDVVRTWNLPDMTNSYDLVRPLSEGAQGDIYFMLNKAKPYAFKIYKTGVNRQYTEFQMDLLKNIDNPEAKAHPGYEAVYFAAMPVGWATHTGKKGLVFRYVVPPRKPRKPTARDRAQVRDQIDFLHWLGYVHLDITDRNIMLGDKDKCYLMDYDCVCKIGEVPLGPLPTELNEAILTQQYPAELDDDEHLWQLLQTTFFNDLSIEEANAAQPVLQHPQAGALCSAVPSHRPAVPVDRAVSPHRIAAASGIAPGLGVAARVAPQAVPTPSAVQCPHCETTVTAGKFCFECSKELRGVLGSHSVGHIDDSRGLDADVVLQIITASASQSSLRLLAEQQEQMQNVVIVMGSAGDGTSTTINYLLGHPLVSARVPQKRRPVVDVDLGALSAAGKSGLALIGHNDYRQTLVPEAVHEPRIPCTVVDTAGFMISDSRGINQKLVTAFALAEAAQYFPAVISAICYVIDYSSFEPARFKTLNLCEEIDSSIRQLLGNCAQVPWKLNPRIFYLINKLPGDLTDKEFEGELKELAEDVQRAHGGRQGVKDFRVEMLRRIARSFVLIKPLEPNARKTGADALRRFVGRPEEEDKQSILHTLANVIENAIGNIPRCYIKRKWLAQVPPYLASGARAIVTEKMIQPRQEVDKLAFVLEDLKASASLLQTTADQIQLKADIIRAGASDINVEQALLKEEKTLLRQTREAEEELGVVKATLERLQAERAKCQLLIDQNDTVEEVVVHTLYVSRRDNLWEEHRLDYTGLPFSFEREVCEHGHIVTEMVNRESGRYKATFIGVRGRESRCWVKLCTYKRETAEAKSIIHQSARKMQQIDEQINDLNACRRKARHSLDVADVHLRVNREKQASKQRTIEQTKADATQDKQELDKRLAELEQGRRRVAAQVPAIVAAADAALQPAFRLMRLFVRSAEFKSSVNQLMKLQQDFEGLVRAAHASGLIASPNCSEELRNAKAGMTGAMVMPSTVKELPRLPPFPAKPTSAGKRT